MFYCEECAKKRGYPFDGVIHQSVGPCELCSRAKVCVDVPSSSLPERKPTRVELAEERLARAGDALRARAIKVISWQGRMSETETSFPKLMGELVHATEELLIAHLLEDDVMVEAVEATDKLVDECVSLFAQNGRALSADDYTVLSNMFARCAQDTVERAKLMLAAERRARQSAETQYQELTGMPPAKQTTYDRMREALESTIKEREALRGANEAASLRDTLKELGWSVGVHNDYTLNGEDHTFWLFTHPSGRFVRGEGRTDAEALKAALDQVHGLTT